MVNEVKSSAAATAASPAQLIAALDVQASRVETPCGSGTMPWRCWGAGPPLLLIHGGHGSWTHWIRNISYFARRHSVWAPDLPGHGESALPERVDEADCMAGVLAAGIRQIFGCEARLDIAAFSFGALLSGHLAVMAPPLVRRLIVVDAGGLDTPLGHMPRRSYRGLTLDAEILAAHRQNLLAVMLHHEGSVDALALHLQQINISRGRVLPGPLLMPDRLARVLARSNVPVDAIWGEFDRPHPDIQLQRNVLQRLRPDLQFRVVPAAGHWSMYENPDAFNRCLDELLDLRFPRQVDATAANFVV
jgi:pimeloyl-ACP methyl ester carboxylesterase